jgi:hypothetical protein
MANYYLFREDGLIEGGLYGKKGGMLQMTTRKAEGES